MLHWHGLQGYYVTKLMSWVPPSTLLATNNLSGVPWNFSRGRSATPQLPKTVCGYGYNKLTLYWIITCDISQGLYLLVTISKGKEIFDE